MTAVTVNNKYDGVMAHEYLNLTVTDGYTYTTGLSKPYGLTYSFAESDAEMAGSAVNFDWTLSGRTFTFRLKTATAGDTVDVFVDIVGRK
jgi:hypothetical protein